MELFYFTEAKSLDDFIKGAAGETGAEFLQSWAGGEIIRQDGEEILRLGVRQTGGGKMLAAVTVVKKSLSSAGYWWSPRGPIFGPDLETAVVNRVFDFLGEEIKKLDARFLFWRIEPLVLPSSAAGYQVKKSVDLNPRQTLVLDLSESEESLLTDLQSKTRYNLRLAEKKGVTVSVGSADDLSEFWRLLHLTGERDGFRLHGEEHYKNLLLGGQGAIKLLLAEYEGCQVAAGLFSFWGDRAVYLHGASDNQYRNVMAPYLLQWTAIMQAKKLGCRYYDFHGIDEKKWPGVTRFKLGFGGRTVSYAGTWDVVFRPVSYVAYNFLRRLRRSLG